VGPAYLVLAAGCGAGELLGGRAAPHGCGGLGFDTSAIVIAVARRRAALRAPLAGLQFAVADAGSVPPDGSYAAACCLGSLHALGGLRDGLAWLSRAARPDGAIVIADGFWAQPPDPAFLAALGATADELPSFEGLLATCDDAGLEPVAVATSTQEDWERYEWTLVSNGDRWARERAGDPLAADVRAWIDAARRRLRAPGGTTTIGFALVVLRPAGRA
jgi:SAM-dependent methyltransferase